MLCDVRLEDGEDVHQAERGEHGEPAAEDDKPGPGAALGVRSLLLVIYDHRRGIGCRRGAVVLLVAVQERRLDGNLGNGAGLGIVVSAEFLTGDHRRHLGDEHLHYLAHLWAVCLLGCQRCGNAGFCERGAKRRW